MSHELYAYRKDEYGVGFDAKSIAEVHRSAGNPAAHELYVALQAVDHNCGCSGCGTSRDFTNQELKDALLRLKDGEDMSEEKKFLEECIKSGTTITICFM
jgi:hypothetical protein